MTDDTAAPDPTPAPGGRPWLVPALVGAVVVVIVVVVALATSGDDDGAEAGPAAQSTDSSTTSSATSSSPPTAGSTTADVPTASDSAFGDPVPSPIINQAVKAAMKDDFPALVPAGVPDGWTVVSATYDGKGGGTWRIDLTDPSGADVVLVQAKASVEELVGTYLGSDGAAEGKVDLSDYGTGVWTGYAAMDVHGVARKIAGTSALVYGASQETAVVFAQHLLTAEDADIPEAG